MRPRAGRKRPATASVEIATDRLDPDVIGERISCNSKDAGEMGGSERRGQRERHAEQAEHRPDAILGRPRTAIHPPTANARPLMVTTAPLTPPNMPPPAGRAWPVATITNTAARTTHAAHMTTAAVPILVALGSSPLPTWWASVNRYAA